MEKKTRDAEAADGRRHTPFGRFRAHPLEPWLHRGAICFVLASLWLRWRERRQRAAADVYISDITRKLERWRCQGVLVERTD